MLMSESRSLTAVSPPADIPNYLARSLPPSPTLSLLEISGRTAALAFGFLIRRAVFCPAGALRGAGRPGGGGHGGLGVGNRARSKFERI